MHVKGEFGAELQPVAGLCVVVAVLGLGVDGAFAAEAVPGGVFLVGLVSLRICEYKYTRVH